MNIGVDLFWPKYAAGLLVLAAAAAHVYAYRRTSKPVPAGLRWLLLEIRLVALGLVLFALWRPAAESETALARRSRLAVLVDASRSMEIADETRGDGGGTASRLRRAAEVFGENRVLWDEIMDSYEVSVYSFARNVESLGVDPRDIAKRVTFGTSASGAATALGDAIHELSRLAGAPEAILVVSDGLSNSGIDPLDAAAPGGPVIHAISVGSSEAGESTRDVAVTGIFAQAEAFLAAQVPVTATVMLTGLAGRPVKLVFFVDGEEAGAKEIVTQRRQAMEEARFTFKAQKAGPARIEVRAEELADEIVAANNSAATFVDVREGTLRVLYVDVFRRDVAATRAAIEATRDVDLRFIIPRGPGDEALSQALLEEWDVYIIGDLSAAHLPAAGMDRIVEAVEAGKGILFLGGNNAFGRGGYDRTPLAALSPLEMTRGDGIDEGSYAPMPLVTGPHGHLVAPDERGEAAEIGQLGPLPSMSLTGPPRPGASVIIEGRPVARDVVTGAVRPDASRRPAPLLAVQEIGGGRAAALTGVGTWQWSMGSGIEDMTAWARSKAAHDRFWRELVFWLARRQQRGEVAVALTLARHRARLGESVEMEARVMDGDLSPLVDAALSARITSGEASFERRFWLEGERYRVDFEPPAAGDYHVAVSALRGEEKIAAAESAFVVAGGDIEYETLVARGPLLDAVARSTGGRYADAAGAAEVFSEIRKRAAGAQYMRRDRRELWSSRWYAAIILALLALEWGVRKLNGLV